MPRKPNYSFERREREKARALKKATRLHAKHEKSDQRNQGNGCQGGESPVETSPKAGPAN